MTLGDLMRERRSELGLTLGAVARHLNVSVATVSWAERGHEYVVPAFDEDRLAEVLEVSAEQVRAASLAQSVTLRSRGNHERELTVYRLACRWEALTEEEVRAIRQICDQRAP